MNNRLNDAERRHLGRVKSLPCSLCDNPGPNEAHHIKQGLQYTAICLCSVCHRDNKMGWHGQRAMWKLRKFDEIDALNVTLERLNAS